MNPLVFYLSLLMRPSYPSNHASNSESCQLIWKYQMAVLLYDKRSKFIRYYRYCIFIDDWNDTMTVWLTPDWGNGSIVLCSLDFVFREISLSSSSQHSTDHSILIFLTCSYIIVGKNFLSSFQGKGSIGPCHINVSLSDIVIDMVVLVVMVVVLVVLVSSWPQGKCCWWSECCRSGWVVGGGGRWEGGAPNTKHPCQLQRIMLSVLCHHTFTQSDHTILS